MTIDTKKLSELLRDGPYLYPCASTFSFMRNAANALDAQAAEIERLNKALRVAVLALANAVQDHGKVYQDAYEVVDAALKFAQERGESNGNQD